MRGWRGLCLAWMLLAPGPLGAESPAAETWALDAWHPPLTYEGHSYPVDYAPLERASRPWLLCAAYPHLKDAYWLSVNYGMVEEAKRLGVGLRVVEAGGYPNLERQRTQIEACVEEGAQALILGPVSYEGLGDLVQRLARRVPVVAAVNDMEPAGISAKAGVSWTEMGRAIGAYFAKLHPKGSAPVKVAWFPGPKGAGWVGFVEAGFKAAMADSSAEIVVTKWGDTGTEIQLILIEEALEEHPDIDYIVGSAVTAEAAVSVLRAQGLTGRIGVLADYFTHGVYRGIKRGKVLAAPTDSPVLQGRLAVDQAVRLLEGQLLLPHVGPQIRILDGANVESFDSGESLAPAWFTPTFTVAPP